MNGSLLFSVVGLLIYGLPLSLSNATIPLQEQLSSQNEISNLFDEVCNDITCLGDYVIDPNNASDTVVTLRANDVSPLTLNCTDIFYVKLETYYDGVLGPDSINITCPYLIPGIFKYVVSNFKEGLDLRNCWGLLSIINAENAFCHDRIQDSTSLVSLYQNSGGANWTNNWDLTQPMDTWYGVELDANGVVTCLDLDGNWDCQNTPNGTGNNLVGGNFSLDLPELIFLSLSNNQLGQDQVFASSLPKLEAFHIENNRLNNVREDRDFAGMPNLKYLNLSNNQLSFEHLLPSADTLLSRTTNNDGNYNYAPQADFFQDTLSIEDLGQDLPQTIEVTQLEKRANLALTVFPNPSKHTTNLQYQLPESTSVHLFISDLNGRIVQTLKTGVSQDAGTYQLQVDLSDLSSGIYNVHLLTPQEKVYRRMIIID